MAPQSEVQMKEEEPILYSSYPTIPMPALSSFSAADLLIKKAHECVEQGKTKWLTDTVTGKTLNFADLEPMSRTVASAMAKRGMTKGDVAIYLTMDVTRIYASIVGVWRLGGIMYSSYPEDTADTLTKRVISSKARWVVCDPICVPQVKLALKEVEWSVEIIVFGQVEGCTSIDEIFEDDGEACPDKIESTLDDPVLILCTSGTTGSSKGAVFTNKNVIGFFVGTSAIPQPSENAPVLLLIRCTHVLGCLFPLRCIFAKVWATLMSQITKTNIFKSVHDYKPSLAFGFPTFLAMMAVDPEAKKYDFSSLECIVSGGILLTSQYYQMMMSLPNMKHVTNGYGMTECGALTTTVDLSSSDGFKMVQNAPPLSVGRLYPNTALKIIDTDTGKALGPNQSGEIAVRSPIMCSGYWNDAEQTASLFQDGWLRTGDMGYYDENGFVYVVDRMKETFKYYNNHISPAELEEVFLRHPAVAEATCFGVKDPEGGDHVPRAVTVLKQNAQATPQEIQEFVDSRVASYKKIRGGVFIVPSIPKGKTGKVVKSMLANMELLQNNNEL